MENQELEPQETQNEPTSIQNEEPKPLILRGSFTKKKTVGVKTD